MPLDSSKLESALYVALNSPTDNYQTGAHRLARAYIDYARGATSCQAATPLPAALDAAQAVLGTTLTAIAAGSQALPQTIAQWATAFAGAWLLPPIPFIGGVTPGLVTVAAPPAFSAALTAALTVNAARAVAGNDVGAREAARALAQALNTATHTVIVAHAPPTVCVGPLV